MSRELETVLDWLSHHGHQLAHHEMPDRGHPHERHSLAWYGVAGRVVMVQAYPRVGFEVFVSAQSHEVSGIIKELEAMYEAT